VIIMLELCDENHKQAKIRLDIYMRKLYDLHRQLY
jgi:hypothetical protein